MALGDVSIILVKFVFFQCSYLPHLNLNRQSCSFLVILEKIPSFLKTLGYFFNYFYM